MDEYLDYAKLIDEAMHIIVKKSLQFASKHGLDGDHHFYISFHTQDIGVQLSDKLKKRYPEEMTIVLQYQFEGLQVFDEYFTVRLSFDGIKETLVIPFNSLTAFADPSVRFGLQFKHSDMTNYPASSYSPLGEEEKSRLKTPSPKTKPKLGAKAEIEVPAPKKDTSNSNNVVALDSFRKKN